MSRRYLTLDEAKSALNRGKSIEIFLGGFICESEKCIRWASFVKSETGVCGSIWEAFDQGSSDYLDIYTFDSPSGEYDEPKQIVDAPSLEAATRELGISNFNYVNQGIVQDEYALYIESSI